MGFSFCNLWFEGPIVENQQLVTSQGVYVIVDLQPAAPAGVVVYVGQAADVQDRIGTHERWPSWKSVQRGRLAAYVCATPGFTETQRLTLERAAINHFNPPCNRC